MLTKNIKTFDALEWINDYFNGEAHIDYNYQRPILCFSLMWNLFETTACNKYATKNAIKQSVNSAHQSGTLDSAKYQFYIDYFRSRYSDFGSIDEAFRRLCLRDQDQDIKDAVRRMVEAKSIHFYRDVEALLLIAFRIRNNLFHGNKELRTLYLQVELFETLNKLLADYIEDISPKQNRN